MSDLNVTVRLEHEFYRFRLHVGNRQTDVISPKKALRFAEMLGGDWPDKVRACIRADADHAVLEMENHRERVLRNAASDFDTGVRLVLAEKEAREVAARLAPHEVDAAEPF